MTKQETIDEITRRLVEFYQPVRIYLFGSEARGGIRAGQRFRFLRRAAGRCAAEPL